MKFFDLLLMSISNLWKRKLRTVLTILGVVIGITSIVVMVALGNGLKESMLENYSSFASMTQIQVSGGGYYDSGNGKSEEKRLDDNLIEEIKAIEHVSAVYPRLNFSVIAKSGKYTVYVRDKLGNTAMKDGAKMYFAVMLTPAKRCSNWSLTNFYLTKSVAYQIGTGCQDEEVYKIIEFEKTYDAQSQLTLQTTGSMASVGVFPESGYNKTTGEFDLKQRLYYNNFNDAPSKFTLDISNYAVGKYYMHIHDVYGEADGLKYLWAIY